MRDAVSSSYIGILIKNPGQISVVRRGIVLRRISGGLRPGIMCSGVPAMIAGYLGNSEVFDNAIVNFAAAYADQTEADHRARVQRGARWRLEAASV
jgi:hypothetical protein